MAFFRGVPSPRAPQVGSAMEGQVGTCSATQRGGDEVSTFRTLSALGSDLASFLSRSRLTRDIIKSATSLLRDRREAQVNLTSILCATMFDFGFRGVLFSAALSEPLVKL